MTTTQTGTYLVGKNFSRRPATVLVTFPTPFDAPPIVHVTALNEENCDNTFAITIARTTRTGFSAYVRRVSTNQEIPTWGQQLRLNWFAIERDDIFNGQIRIGKNHNHFDCLRTLLPMKFSETGEARILVTPHSQSSGGVEETFTSTVKEIRSKDRTVEIVTRRVADEISKGWSQELMLNYSFVLKESIMYSSSVNVGSNKQREELYRTVTIPSRVATSFNNPTIFLTARSDPLSPRDETFVLSLRNISTNSFDVIVRRTCHEMVTTWDQNLIVDCIVANDSKARRVPEISDVERQLQNTYIGNRDYSYDHRYLSPQNNLTTGQRPLYSSVNYPKQLLHQDVPVMPHTTSQNIVRQSFQDPGYVRETFTTESYAGPNMYQQAPITNEYHQNIQRPITKPYLKSERALQQNYSTSHQPYTRSVIQPALQNGYVAPIVASASKPATAMNNQPDYRQIPVPKPIYQNTYQASNEPSRQQYIENNVPTSQKQPYNSVYDFGYQESGYVDQQNVNTSFSQPRGISMQYSQPLYGKSTSNIPPSAIPQQQFNTSTQEQYKPIQRSMYSQPQTSIQQQQQHNSQTVPQYPIQQQHNSQTVPQYPIQQQHNSRTVPQYPTQQHNSRTVSLHPTQQVQSGRMVVGAELVAKMRTAHSSDQKMNLLVLYMSNPSYATFQNYEVGDIINEFSTSSEKELALNTIVMGDKLPSLDIEQALDIINQFEPQCRLNALAELAPKISDLINAPRLIALLPSDYERQQGRALLGMGI